MKQTPVGVRLSGPVALCVFSIMASGCGPASRLPDAGAEQHQPDPTAHERVRPETRPTTLIGPEGGQVVEGGAAIDVPEGALQEDEPITISLVDVDLPAGWRQLSPVYRFQPEGLQFSAPATVEFEVDDPDLSDVSVLWSGDDGASWDALETNRSDGVVSASIDHFSLGVAARPATESDAGIQQSEDGGESVPTDAGHDDDGGSPPPDGGADDAGVGGEMDGGEDSGPCVPTVCGAAACGGVDDGCGGILACGTCSAPETCGGGGAVGECGCAPRTCGSLGATCGTLDDGCGATLTCGACAGTATCGGGGDPLRCGEPLCVDGWCWQSPRPTGGIYYGVHGTSANDVWAVGLQGSALHWEGSYWRQTTTATLQTLTSVSAIASDDVWAAGTGGIALHWDGAAWTEHATGALGTLWGTYAAATDDVWVVGEEGVFHYDGTSWTQPLSNVAFYGIWGDGPASIWAVGQGGVIAHYAGSSWSPVTTSITEDLFGISGSSSGDVIAIGSSATYAFNGSSWSQVVARGGFAVAVDGPGTFYSAGYQVRRWNGATSELTLALIESGSRGWGAYSAPTGELFVVGESPGSIIRFDGVRWHTGSFPLHHLWTKAMWGFAEGELSILGSFGLTNYPTGTGVHLELRGGEWTTSAMPLHAEAAWPNAWDDVWAVGRTDSGAGAIGHFDGSAWALVVDDAPERLDAVWGSSARNMWMASYRQLFHFDGASLISVEHPEIHSFSDVWGSGPHDVWIVGDRLAGASSGEDLIPAILHFDGTAWTTADLTLTDSAAARDPRLSAVWGSGPNDVWAVGVSGYASTSSALLAHYDGAGWTEVTTPFLSGTESHKLSDVWGTGPSDVWVGGAPVMHFDGSAWSVIDGEGRADVIGGTGSDEVYMAGYDGLLRWDGTHLASTTDVGRAPTSYSASDAWASSADDVWIGQRGGVVRWDGARWDLMDIGNIAAISGTSQADVWAVAEYSAAYHWDGGTWTPRVSGLTGYLRGVHSLGVNDVWAAGSDGLFHWNGFAWSAVLSDSLNDVWASSSSDVWAVSSGGVIHGGASASSYGYEHTDGDAYYTKVSGTGSADVWAFGNKISHWDGADWTHWASPTGVAAAIVVGAGDVWVSMPPEVNEPPTVVSHWNGATWTSSFLPITGGVLAFASAGGVVTAIGEDGQVMRLSP